MFTPNFAFTPEQEEFRAEVQAILCGDAVRHELMDAKKKPPWRNPAGAYRALGRTGLLAPDWPADFGGRSATIVESAIVAEEMSLAGIPDSARVNTIDNAGSTILAAGTEEQKSAYLPGMAAGERFAVVLYSEPEAGSDLGALSTHAERDGDGWRLTGEKIWNVGAPEAEFGICLARTDDGASKYSGLSVFIAPLHAAGVGISEVDSFNPEAFNHVVFDRAPLSDDALVGELGGGWQLINTALAVERTGVYFYGHAQRWLNLLTEFELTAAAAEQAEMLQAELDGARLLTWRCVDLLRRGEDATAAATSAKWWTSELTGRVAELAWQCRPSFDAGPAAQHPGEDRGLPSATAELVNALSEAPGLAIAGGTSEMMLATVSAALLDDVLEVAG